MGEVCAFLASQKLKFHSKITFIISGSSFYLSGNRPNHFFRRRFLILL